MPLLLVLLLLGPAFYYSRESPMKIAFSRSCGDNESQECYSVAEGDDGAYVVVGENEGITEDDTGMYLVKIDGKGSLMWEMKKYAVSTDYQTRIVPVGDGFVVLAEKWGSPYLVRIDGDGATLWERMYEENLTADYFATSIASHPRGGFLVVGEVQNYETEMVDCFAWMIGTMGERVWERIYPGDGEDHPTCVVAAEGGFVILGVSNSTEDEGMYRIYLRKIDDGGKELWCRAITGVFPYQTWQGLEAHQLICCADGGFAMAGWIDSTYLDPSSQTRSDAYIIRTDAHGEVIWERTYGTERNERAFSIVETEDRGFLVAGWARREQVADPTGPMRIDTYLLRVSARGEEIWSRRIRRGARDLTANAMIRSTDGGYVVVGCKEFRTSRDACGLIWQPDFHILKIREEEWTPIPKCSPYLLVVAGSLAVVVQLAIRRKHKWQTEG